MWGIVALYQKSYSFAAFTPSVVVLFLWTEGVDCKTHTRLFKSKKSTKTKSQVNNNQWLYFTCGGLGTNIMIAGWKRRLANIMTPSISDTTKSWVNTIRTDFLWSIPYLYHLYYKISMSASLQAMLVTWLQIVPTLTAPTTAPVRKDTPGTESHVEVWSLH